MKTCHYTFFIVNSLDVRGILQLVITNTIFCYNNYNKYKFVIIIIIISIK